MISRTAPGELLGNTIHAFYILQIHATSTSLHLNISGEINNDNRKREDGSLSCFFRVQWRSESLNHVLRIIGVLAAIESSVFLPLMALVFCSSVDRFNAFGAGDASSGHFARACPGMRFGFSLFIGRFVPVSIRATSFSLSGTKSQGLFAGNSLSVKTPLFPIRSPPSTVPTNISNKADIVQNRSGEKPGLWPRQEHHECSARALLRYRIRSPLHPLKI